MCRNIKPIFNFDPPATEEEITNASLQFVRKLSGFQKPSNANEKAFNNAVEKIAGNVKELMDSLESNTKPKNREIEAEKLRIKNIKRFNDK